MHFLTTNWLLILGIVALAWVGVRSLSQHRGHDDNEDSSRAGVNPGGQHGVASGEGYPAQGKSAHKHHGGCC